MAAKVETAISDRPARASSAKLQPRRPCVEGIDLGFESLAGHRAARPNAG